MKLKKEKTIVKHEGLIHFDSGNPSADMFPIDDYKKAINMALENDGSTIFDYDEGKGSKDLREKICTISKRQKNKYK